jgi:hypothetical protein
MIRLTLLHIFILRLSVSMDHNGVAVHVCWVLGWAVGRGLGRLSHTSPGPVRLPPPSGSSGGPYVCVCS